MASLRTAAALALACAVALAACGGGDGDAGASFERGGPPPPARCLERWNGDREAVTDGLHSYEPHRSRAARVFDLGDEYPELAGSCAVVFAVPESDREYGTVGWFESGERWEVMTLIPSATPEQRGEIQRRATEGANARLLSDGRLGRFE